MAKVQTKDIARLIAKKKNMDISDAEMYVDAFFSLIYEGLMNDKIAKVKGLGTFKLVDVRERESVDVNTGERVVIDGHSKMSFQPDTTLKELVNKPFSQFETVVLNDGVNEEVLANVEYKEESTIDDSSENASTEDSLLQEDELQEENTIQSNGSEEDIESVASDFSIAESSVTSEHVMLDNHKEENATSTQHEVTINTSMDVEDNAIIEKSSDNLIEPEDKQVNSSVEEKSSTEERSAKLGGNSKTMALQNEMTETKESSENGKQIFDEEEAVEENSLNNKPSFIRKIFLYGIIAIGIVAIFFCGYYLGDRNQSDNKDKTPKTVVVRKVSHKKTSIKQKPKTLTETTIKTNEKVDTASLAQKNKTTELVKETVTSFDNKSEANIKSLSNVRRIVKTGAYNIVGTEKKITVKKGQTMKSIARMYLGEGMECYIQLHNGKLEVSEGETINIPKVELKKKATNKKVS